MGEIIRSAKKAADRSAAFAGPNLDRQPPKPMLTLA